MPTPHNERQFMKIYTRQGDAGATGLFDGRRVAKDDPRINAYGAVDELNSFLGVAVAAGAHPDLAAILRQIQHELFSLGADLATPENSRNATKIHRIPPEAAAALETIIDLVEARLVPLTQFILPGGAVVAAHLHVARTVCRRAERLVVTLSGGTSINPQCLVYLNRLSDLLFVLSRWANALANVPDVPWKKTNGVGESNV